MEDTDKKETQKNEEMPLPKFNFKIKKERLPLLLICLLIILGSLIYIAFFCKEITTITYPDGCKEVYINNKLNGTVECDRSQLSKQKIPVGEMPSFNFTIVT